MEKGVKRNSKVTVEGAPSSSKTMIKEVPGRLKRDEGTGL